MVGTLIMRRHQETGLSTPHLQYFPIQDVGGWSKYGTLNGGSALSKSMKYAESWLYGSMRGPPSGSMNPACLFGTVRAPPTRSRPRLPALQSANKDPYDMVRRSRMGRAKSCSPPARRSILDCRVNPYDLIDGRPESSDDDGWSDTDTLVPSCAMTPRRPPRKRDPEQPEIKSILKKPAAQRNCISSSGKGKNGHGGAMNGGNGNTSFRPSRSSFREYKAKKKKQVQFRDHDSPERVIPRLTVEEIRTMDNSDSDSSTESTGSGRFQRSLNERLCSDGLIPGTKELVEERVPTGFNDTMRLRQRAPRRDARATFADHSSSGNSTPRRGLSPGRPRPREPPPPPPPPQLSTIKPPPAPPPRQIFPFTKEQIRKLNENRPAEYVPTKILTLEQPQYENKNDCVETPLPEPVVSFDKNDEPVENVPVEEIKIIEPDLKSETVSTEIEIDSEETIFKNEPHKVPDVIEIKEEAKVKLTIPAQDDYQENKTIVSIDTPPSEQNYGVIVEQPNISVTSVNIEPEIISGNKVTININSVPEPEYVSQVIIVGTDASAPPVSKAQEEIEELIRSRIDPVEAARANLIPHICGRDPATESDMSSDSYKSALDSFASEPPYPEKDKLVDEVEVQLGIDFDSDESHYETIRDPIYEEIGEGSDTPPPLPTSPPPALVEPVDELIPTKSIFEGATKYDILSYLVGAKRRGIVTEDELSSPGHSRISSLDLSSQISQLSAASDSSEDSCQLILPPTDISFINEKLRKSSAEVERNDSGVGSETSRSRWQHLSNVREDAHHTCEDCDQHVETQVTDSGVMFAPLVCRKCSKRRSERREIITEIVETEEKYGRDLRIILEEFYRPMKVAGLLSTDQLSAIFLNTEELLEHNTALAEKLRDALEIAIEQGDEDLLTVNIGALFLEATPMLHAFESYCTRQGAASMLLTNLEKEKELLRIFLRVSQMENSVLRRMNLNSFLMVPVQRITKYPLLLSRLYKVSPSHVIGKEAIKEAQHNIELHLEHINYLAKDISTNKLWRRISVTNGRRYSSEMDMVNIKLRKIAVDVLEWTHDEVRFAMEGKLLFTQPTDTNWRKRATIKLSPINAVLVTLGKPTEDYQPDSEDTLVFPRTNGIRDATIVLMKEKGGRYTLLREPLYLDRCIVCAEADLEDYFEVQELPTKDTYIFKAEDGELTKRWYRQVQYHAQGLGSWRKRRNALANIMINGMQLRT